ncbi:MAG: hypothetical protein H7837_01710 [Magnetococcus sp. MYC-9]
MAKKASQTVAEIFDQVAKARQALDFFDERALDERGEFLDAAAVRARLNAAKAHVMRGMEKAQNLR